MSHDAVSPGLHVMPLRQPLDTHPGCTHGYLSPTPMCLALVCCLCGHGAELLLVYGIAMA